MSPVCQAWRSTVGLEGPLEPSGPGGALLSVCALAQLSEACVKFTQSWSFQKCAQSQNLAFSCAWQSVGLVSLPLTRSLMVQPAGSGGWEQFSMAQGLQEGLCVLAPSICMSGRAPKVTLETISRRP